MRNTGILCLLCSAQIVSGQEPRTRTQYPVGLNNAYFGFSIGHINYGFSTSHLEKNVSVGSIEVPHTAVRFTLYGYRLNRHLSAQVSYMRPVTFARYNDVAGDGASHNVWMSIGGLTLTGDFPAGRKWSLSGESGLGVVTRRGFLVNNEVVMKNVSYATLLSSISIQYKLSKKWVFRLGTAYTPENERVKQPATIYHSLGFNYCMSPLPAEKVQHNAKAGFPFSRNIFYAGYSTNLFGYGVNRTLSEGTVPVFWGGDAKVRRGFTLNFQRNIFHTKKVFAFDWGASFGAWESRNLRQNFYTISLSPVFRFMVLRSKAIDMGIEYSVAGPTYISRPVIDLEKTGSHFTFYDFMGINLFAGKKKNIFGGLRIAHFSNGNMLPDNQGVMVPLTLNVGMSY